MSQYSPVRFVNVRLEGDFWRERLETVLTRTIPSQHVKLGEYGILGSLKLPQPPPPLRFPRHANGFTVQVFWDSDVGKWIEAASYALSHRRDADIEAKIEAIVDDFEKAQEPDGYLNCWYLDREPENRWTNLRDNTSSTTPGTCSRAPLPISRPPVAGAGSASWSATSSISATRSVPLPVRSVAIAATPRSSSP